MNPYFQGYRPTFKDRLFTFVSWFEHIGWMILSAIVILGSVIYGAFALTIASPVAKLSTALGSLVILLVFKWLFTPILKKASKAEKVENPTIPLVITFFVVLFMVIKTYADILASLVSPWPLMAILIFGYALSALDEILKRKKIDASKKIIIVGKIVGYIFGFVTLYYLAILLGWL